MQKAMIKANSLKIHFILEFLTLRHLFVTLLVNFSSIGD